MEFVSVKKNYTLESPIGKQNEHVWKCLKSLKEKAITRKLLDFKSKKMLNICPKIFLF